MNKSEFKLVRMKRAVNALISDVKNREFPADIIILFGSVLGSDFNEYSDLDVCIVHDNELSDRQNRELAAYFNKMLNDEMEVDFIFCDREKLKNGTHVFESIRKHGRVLY